MYSFNLFYQCTVHITDLETNKKDHINLTQMNEISKYNTIIRKQKNEKGKKLEYETLKEARTGCGLKNRLRKFFLIFAYVIFMVFRLFLCEENHTSP